MMSYETMLERMIGSLRVSTSGVYMSNSPFTELDFLVRNEFKPVADAGGMGGKVGAALHPNFYSGSWMDKKSWVSEVMMFVFSIWPQGVPKIKALAGISIIPDDIKRSRKVATAIYLVKNVLVDINEAPRAGQATIAALRFMWPRVSFLANKMSKRILASKGFLNDWVRSREKEYYAPYCLAGVSLSETAKFLNRWSANTSAFELTHMIGNSKFMQQLFKFADQLYLSEEKKFMTKGMKAASPVETFEVSDEVFRTFMEDEMGVENVSVSDNRILQSAKTAFSFEDRQLCVVSYKMEGSSDTSRWNSARANKSSREEFLSEIREALEEAGFPDDTMLDYF